MLQSNKTPMVYEAQDTEVTDTCVNKTYAHVSCPKGAVLQSGGGGGGRSHVAMLSMKCLKIITSVCTYLGMQSTLACKTCQY